MGPVPVLPLAGTQQPPPLSPSPEKEAFKKRPKLQDNGEETDENEGEEVRGALRSCQGGVVTEGCRSPPRRGTEPSLASQGGWGGQGLGVEVGEGDLGDAVLRGWMGHGAAPRHGVHGGGVQK